MLLSTFNKCSYFVKFVLFKAYCKLYNIGFYTVKCQRSSNPAVVDISKNVMVVAMSLLDLRSYRVLTQSYLTPLCHSVNSVLVHQLHKLGYTAR